MTLDRFDVGFNSRKWQPERFFLQSSRDIRRFIIKILLFNDNVILFLRERLDGADPSY